MASPFKHISQIQTLADFAKLSKQVIGKLGEDPVKALYFPKFKFDKKEAPLLLIGDLPTPVLMEVKKAAGGAPVIGQCFVNPADQLVFEGGVKPAMARAALLVMGIQKVVATSGDDAPEAPKEKSVEGKTVPVAPPKPVTPPPPNRPLPKPPVTQGKIPTPPPPLAPKAQTPIKTPIAPQPPKPQGTRPLPPTPTTKNPEPKQGIPPPPPPPQKIAEGRKKYSKQLDKVFPLFQDCFSIPGAPEKELQRLLKVAGKAAVAEDFEAAVAHLQKLEALANETLSKGPESSEEEEEDYDEKTAAGRKLYGERLNKVFPLFHACFAVPGAPEAQLHLLLDAAGDAAVDEDFEAAVAHLDELEALTAETLKNASGTSDEAKEGGEKEGSEEEEEEIVDGQFVKSRKAWQKAMREAGASISALQAAVLKTKDPRASGLASGFRRILKKIPNPSAALEALAIAAEKKDADAAAKHKTEALRLAKLCTTYLGSDRLVTLAVENPFVPLKLTDHFKSALQTLNAELK